MTAINGGARIYHLNGGAVAGVIDQAPKVPVKKRLKAFGFVALAFLFWFVFVSLARIVQNCALTYELWPLVQCTAIDLTSLKHMGWAETTMMVVTLVVAIWAARRAVFPPEE